MSERYIPVNDDDTVKEVLTSHWDMDVLPRDQIEAMYRQGRRQSALKKGLRFVLYLSVLPLAAGLFWAGRWLVINF